MKVTKKKDKITLECSEAEIENIYCGIDNLIESISMDKDLSITGQEELHDLKKLLKQFKVRMKHKPLNEYAEEILSDYHHLSEPAFEYAKAMKELDQITDMYMNDTAKSVVLYFLANASTWRGETARRIKKELNKIVKDAT